MRTVKLISGDYVKELSVKEKTNLLVLVHESGLFIDAPCGGQGVCRRCTVLIDGEPRLACKTSIEKDITVVLPQEKWDGFIFLSKKMNPSHLINPVITKIEVSVDPVFRASCQSDIEYLRKILKLNIAEPGDAGLLSKISEAVRAKKKYTLYLFEQAGQFEIIDIIEKTGLKNLGVAVDLGTTTISVALMDIGKGKIIDSLTFYNPQIMFGEDVIHRIIFSEKGNGARILKEKAVHEVNLAIKNLCLKNKLTLEEIKSIVFSGNTTMAHLFLGLPAGFIRQTPYTSGAIVFPVLDAGSVIDKDMRGKVFVMPCPANYFGGDMVSGIAACDMQNKKEINILLDIGTNGEVVIGNKDWLIGCACSAGPAFEGMGLNCGIRYKEGAITDASFNRGRFNYKIAGNTKPCGISGTGIIGLIRCLREENYIDKRGKFTDKVKDKMGHKQAFILFDENETMNNEFIYADKSDIDNILRAKAAIYSGISLMLKKLSLNFDKIDNLYVAGGIGNSLNVDNALHIGLFPPLDKRKIRFVGNTSLTGAVKYLLCKKAREDVTGICNKTTYIDLSNEPAYMDEFMAALFIPHTDY